MAEVERVWLRASLKVPCELAEDARNLVKEFFLGGSRVTCNPPVTDTDRDIVYLVENQESFAEALMADGWAMGGSMHPIDCAQAFKYVSMRKESENAIFTEEHEFFRRFRAATCVSKRLNLMKKEDRIALFQAVLYGNDC